MSKQVSKTCMTQVIEVILIITLSFLHPVRKKQNKFMVQYFNLNDCEKARICGW